MTETLFAGNDGRVYKVMGELGRGGFGVVHLVEDDEGQRIALKVLARAGDRATVSFRQEVESTLGLAHPNVLCVKDYGTALRGGAEVFFVVTEYCLDGDYRKILDRYADRWPGSEAVIQDFRQILQGLAQLHTRIVHRDVKPENILCTKGTLKVGDFGLAKFADASTRTLTFKGYGTPSYMAPEVWEMKPASRGSDLYAVGVMLYEGVTGKLPYRADDIGTLRQLHLHSTAPRPKDLNPEVPGFLDDVVVRLLGVCPSNRE